MIGNKDAHTSVGTRGVPWRGRPGARHPVSWAPGRLVGARGWVAVRWPGVPLSLSERRGGEVWAGCSGSLGPFLLAGSCLGLEYLHQ